MMHQHIRGADACVRPFHPIRSIEFSKDNTLSSTSFRRKEPKPLLQVLTDWLTDMILQEGKP